jgi:hypothetical protein
VVPHDGPVEDDEIRATIDAEGVAGPQNDIGLKTGREGPYLFFQT